MRSRKLMAVSSMLLLATAGEGQQGQRFVVLPGTAAVEIPSAGAWQPSQTDIDGLETNLPRISGLKASGWPSTIHIDHPEQYFRQYVPIIRAGEKVIYINAFCDPQPLSYWRDRLVVVYDGATCYWQALYDPTTKKFSELRINSRG